MNDQSKDLDLASLDVSTSAEQGAVLTLHHPVTKDPLPVKIWLQGTDASAYRTAVRRQVDDQIAAGKADLSAAELEERHIERLAAVTLKWEHVTYHGQSLDCSVANALTLYREQIWIREQVTYFVEDRTRFWEA
ncbi:MAG: hypothetical protein ABJN40_12965 [Sneathiella sp.]